MYRFLASLLTFALLCPAAPADALRSLNGFDAFAERALQQHKSPGAAVGVIQDGKVLLAKGYGVRDLTAKNPVTSKTVFATGSVTKSFTATVLATLVAEGKLDWDRPVREYLPWFRLYDPIATELVNVRDMLSHRTGLPRHDFIRFSTYLTREELLRRIRYMEPSRTFRDVYQYNNLMYAAAGHVAGVLAGSTWEELVEARIFKPLGMTRSSTSVLEMQASDDFAKPHLPSSEGPRETAFYVYQQFGVGPNGAVNSCVDDLLKYLQMHLDAGKPLLPKSQWEELWKPVTVAGPFHAYALGWQTGFYRGFRRVEHGGAITGFRAHVMLFPEQRAAVAAVINSETNLATILAEELSDRILGLAPMDRAPARPAPRRPNQPPRQSKPPRPIEEYAGAYSNPAYGRIRVEALQGTLRVRFDAASVTLVHMQNHSFETGEGQPAEFRLDENGQVREMHLPLEPAVKPFVFVKD